ncbi:MAG: heat-inducible transcriptional repressor HrcA [Clostridiaceae bacterium]|nr:heat-inducible transcriptional repressor HrcA [Clostridiales bacterium]MDD6878084.1 heat-inducible transcriptional repressor HrcA [Clostridiaceae bacterium]MDY3072553.1 heat-inducible transcriptional repressor HrcA [Eubacteriales bacterium]MDY3286041.1 heat-inducible transcriptional repressor HrcA [Eubacteriales bacterium]
MKLSDRKKQILKAVVDDYIQTAEPVGSKAIAVRLTTPVSSATVRNEMSELENLGYLEQPHTSAGRVPSHAAYRLYVDELMSRYQMTAQDMTEVRHALGLRMRELDRLISEAGRMVSELTHHTAIALTPAAETESVRRFEVIAVEKTTVVLVLVTSSDQIKNRICRLNVPLSDFEVAAANRALNNYFTNIPLGDMNGERITRAEVETGAEISELLVAAIDFAADVLNRILNRDLYLAGAAQLLQYPEYRDVDRARALLECLSDRETLQKLPAPQPGETMRISIGSENGVEPLADASVVVSAYEAPHGAKGLIGIVGPTRMDYAKVCARLEKFAEGLSRMLTEQEGTEDQHGEGK